MKSDSTRVSCCGPVLILSARTRVLKTLYAVSVSLFEKSVRRAGVALQSSCVFFSLCQLGRRRLNLTADACSFRTVLQGMALIVAVSPLSRYLSAFCFKWISENITCNRGEGTARQVRLPDWSLSATVS